MIKYDLLVYFGLVPLLAAFIIAAYIIHSTTDNVDLEVRRVRVAGGVLIALAAVYIFAAILYFVDPGGAGKEIFDKSSTAILALVGTIIGYIFGTGKK
jgi:cytochrome bd-type quinol oxidase subunit 2